MRLTKLCLLLIPITQALTIVDSILATQCIFYLKELDWGCNSKGNTPQDFNCRCQNQNWLGSVTNCLESEGADRETIEHAYKHVQDRCKKKGKIDMTVPFMKMCQQNATQNIKEASENDLWSFVNHPVAVNATQFAFPRQSFNHILAQTIRSQAYQWGFIVYWLSIFLFATILNCLRNAGVMKGRLRTPFNISIELIINFFFMVYMIIATCTGFEVKLPNAYQHTHHAQILNLLAHRTGLNAFTLIPPTVIFAIRNNPLVLVTGFSPATFMVFHRWCAYGLTIQAIVHSVAWSYYAIDKMGYPMHAMDAFWQWGVAGTAVVSLMVLHPQIRHYAYEIFILMHKSLGIAFIVTMWLHCYTLGWMTWVYVTIAIWATDYVVRGFKIWNSGGVQVASISMLENGLIRVLFPKGRRGTYFPGCYQFIYFLKGMRSSQSHPFSVMPSMREGEENSLCVVFKAHSGITRNIASMLEQVETISMNIINEGPYGHRIPLNSYDQYVFISAGIGFTPLYSHAVHIVKNSDGKIGQKKVRFVWVVKTLEYFAAFLEDMVYLIENGVNLDVHISDIQSTGSDIVVSNSFAVSSDSSDNSEDEKVKDTANVVVDSMDERVALLIKMNPTLSRENVQFFPGRPVLEDLIGGTDLRGPTAFVSSGPESFTENVGDAVKHLEGGKVDYFEESFVF